MNKSCFITDKEEKLLNRLLKKLKENIIIVEGKKDKRALIELGCDAKNIILLSGRTKSLEKILKKRYVDSVVHGSKIQEVIVLTDLDKTGEKLLKQNLDTIRFLGFRVDDRTRRYLSSILHLRFWENLNRKLEKIKRFKN